MNPILFVGAGSRAGEKRARDSMLPTAMAILEHALLPRRELAKPELPVHNHAEFCTVLCGLELPLNCVYRRAKLES